MYGLSSFFCVDLSLKFCFALNPLKKLAGQTVIYGLGSVVPRFLNYLLVPYHTHLFEKAEYGIITELYTYMTFMVILLTYGMETGFFRFTQNSEDKPYAYGSAFVSLLTTSTLFVAGIYLLTGPITQALGYTAHPEYIRWFAWILALDAVCAVPFARLRQQNKPLQFAGIKIVNVLTNIFFTFFFFWFCPKYAHTAFIQSFWSPDVGVGYVFIANLIASVVSLLLLMPYIIGVEIRFRWEVWKRMIVYALPLLLAGLAGNVNEAIDRTMLKHLLPLPEHEAMAELGVYGANIKIAVLMTLFIQMFRYAAEPFFFNDARKANSRQTIADTTKYFILFALLIFLGITLYIDIFKYFIEPRYWEGLHIVPVMAAANMMLGIYYTISIWFKLNNKTHFALIIASIGAIISITGNLLLIPVIGYTGSACIHLFCYSVMVFLTWRAGQKHYPVPYDWKTIGKFAVLAAVLFAAARLTMLPNLALNLLKNTILIGIFCFVAYKKEYHNFISYNA